jgi:hypothetical protein
VPCDVVLCLPPFIPQPTRFDAKFFVFSVQCVGLVLSVRCLVSSV